MNETNLGFVNQDSKEEGGRERGDGAGWARECCAAALVKKQQRCDNNLETAAAARGAFALPQLQPPIL